MTKKIKIYSIKTPEIRNREYGYCYYPIEQAINAFKNTTGVDVNVIVLDNPDKFHAVLKLEGPRSHVRAMVSEFKSKGKNYFILKKCLF